MTNINILYDGIYDDVDIIMIPDNIVGNIDIIAQEFLDWMPSNDDEDYWVSINNRKCVAKGVKGFVKWLNTKYCLNNKAAIVKQNVSYCPEYKTIFF